MDEFKGLRPGQRVRFCMTDSGSYITVSLRSERIHARLRDRETFLILDVHLQSDLDYPVIGFVLNENTGKSHIMPIKRTFDYWVEFLD